MRATPLPGPSGGSLNTTVFAPDHMGTCMNALLDDAGCAVVVCDTHGRISFVNEATKALSDLSGDETLVGKRLHDLMPASTADVRLSLIQRALHGETGSPHVGLCATDGAWRRLTVRALDRTPGAERALLVCAPLAEPVTLQNLIGPQQAFCEIAVDLGALSKLTEREMQVLRLIGLGLSTQEIAERMHRSKKTIEWHRVSLGAKLEVSNRVELARLALRAGLTWFNEDAITHIWRHAVRPEQPAHDDTQR